MATTVSSSLEEQIFAAKRRAEEFTRSIREAREREALALEALESERQKWGYGISIRDSYKSNEAKVDDTNVNNIKNNDINVIESKEDLNNNDILNDDNIKNEENRELAINDSIDGSIGSFALMSPNRSFDSTTDHHKDKEKSLQLQVISLEKQIKALRNELIIASTELRVSKSHIITLEQRLAEHMTSTSTSTTNNINDADLFTKLTKTEAYAKGLENRLEDVDKTYKLQLSSEEKLRAVLKNRVAELEKGFVEQKVRADKMEIEVSHSSKDTKSLTVELERLVNVNCMLESQLERSKIEIRNLNLQLSDSNKSASVGNEKINTLIPTIATQESRDSQQSLKKWIEEFKNSERYNVDNDAVNIEDGLDTFATSSVLNPDRAFQSLIERKNIVTTDVNCSNDSHLQFKKVKEKKQQDIITSPPSSNRLQQPKPQNSKITSPYNLSSLAAKSPINSIFRSINSRVNESFENKNKKSIKVTLPSQSITSRNVKSSGYGEKKPKNPVKQQRASVTRLNKGSTTKQPTRSSHDSNKAVDISMASSLSLGEGPSRDSMFSIEEKKKPSTSQAVARSSLTTSKSSTQRTTAPTTTTTTKRSSSVDARNKIKR